MTIAKMLYKDVAGYMEHTFTGAIVQPTWSKIIKYLRMRAVEERVSDSDILCTYEDGSTILIGNPNQCARNGFLSLQQETPFEKFFPNVKKVDKRETYISEKEYLSEKGRRQKIVNESCDDLSSEVQRLQRKINAYQCMKLACRLEQYAASLRMNADFLEGLEEQRKYSINLEDKTPEQKEENK